MGGCDRGRMIKIKEENEIILAQIAFVLPMVQRALNHEIGIVYTDREKVRMYKPGKDFVLPTKENSPLLPGTGIYRIIHEKLPYIMVRVAKEVQGVPFTSKAGAIYNKSGDIIGAMAITQSVERQESLKEMASSLLNSISTLASTAEEITAQSQEMTSITGELAKVAETSQVRVNETNQVLGFIKDLAGETNLLGLNAAIEAARVGEQGRGFSVVANEIRKLSFNSAESITNISNIISRIQADSAVTCRKISQVEEGISQVAKAIAHMASATEELRILAHYLDETAESY
jgi:hypothetical protein